MKSIRKIRNRKLINEKRLIGLTSIILVGTLLTACKSDKEYKYSRVDCSSDGNFSETIQFKPFDTEKKYPNSLTYYGEWKKTEDDNYSRIVMEYNIKNKTYNDIKRIIDNNLDLDEELGKPINSFKQIISEVNEEDLERGAHFDATIYSKDEGCFVTIVDYEEKPTTLLGACLVGASLASGVLVAWRKNENNRLARENGDNKKLTLKR